MLKAAAEAENSSKNVSVSNIWKILVGGELYLKNRFCNERV